MEISKSYLLRTDASSELVTVSSKGKERELHVEQVFLKASEVFDELKKKKARNEKWILQNDTKYARKNGFNHHSNPLIGKTPFSDNFVDIGTEVRAHDTCSNNSQRCLFSTMDLLCCTLTQKTTRTIKLRRLKNENKKLELYLKELIPVLDFDSPNIPYLNETVSHLSDDKKKQLSFAQLRKLSTQNVAKLLTKNKVSDQQIALWSIINNLHEASSEKIASSFSDITVRKYFQEVDEFLDEYLLKIPLEKYQNEEVQHALSKFLSDYLETEIILDSKNIKNIVKSLHQGKKIKDIFSGENVILEVEGEHINVDRKILLSLSPIFNTLLLSEILHEGKVKTINIRHCNMNGVRAAIEFGRYGHVKITEENFHDILQVADLFQIEKLILYCESFLDNFPVFLVAEWVVEILEKFKHINFCASALETIYLYRLSTIDPLKDKKEYARVCTLLYYDSSFDEKNEKLSALLITAFSDWGKRLYKQRRMNGGEIFKNFQFFAEIAYFCDFKNVIAVMCDSLLALAQKKTCRKLLPDFWKQAKEQRHEPIKKIIIDICSKKENSAFVRQVFKKVPQEFAGKR